MTSLNKIKFGTHNLHSYFSSFFLLGANGALEWEENNDIFVTTLPRGFADSEVACFLPG